MKTKPFNLEEALSGSKVVTRDGREVSQLTKFIAPNDLFILSGVVGGRVECWTEEGRYNIENENKKDLLLAVPIQRFWVNVYESEFSEMYLGRTHSSLEDAKAWSCKPGYIKTIEITNEP